MRTLVVGDLHLCDSYEGYLESQLDTLLYYFDDIKPSSIVFLGDIFHHRHPTPTVIVETFRFFKLLETRKYLKRIDIVRGNHDTEDKSDNCNTILSILSSDKTLVSKHVSDPCSDGYFFIPHYEDENTIIDALKFSEASEKSDIIFGHFGYDGCVETGQYFSFKIKKEHFGNNRVYLGHIHRYSKDENVTIVGTPWSTNFGESDYKHYMILIDGDREDLIEVDRGPRFMSVDFNSLDSVREEITDKKYHTILRVFVDRFNDETSNDLRFSIKNSLGLPYVDIKFKPIFDKKLDNRISNYVPITKVESISNDILEKFIEEQASSIPREALMDGLNKIKSYEDNETKGQ